MFLKGEHAQSSEVSPSLYSFSFPTTSISCLILVCHWVCSRFVMPIGRSLVFALFKCWPVASANRVITVRNNGT
eukprot:jgi/Picre1/34443/NNA_001911.t1